MEVPDLYLGCGKCCTSPAMSTMEYFRLYQKAGEEKMFAKGPTPFPGGSDTACDRLYVVQPEVGT